MILVNVSLCYAKSSTTSDMICNLDIKSKEIVTTKMLSANIGVFAAVNISSAREELENKCDELNKQYSQPDSGVTCACKDFYPQPPKNAFHSAEYYATFLCEKELTSIEFKQSICNRIYQCIASASPDQNTRWLEKKMKSLNCEL